VGKLDIMTASLVEPVTQRRAAVTRYAAVATVARLGDAGGGIGVLLLAVDRLGAGRGAVAGGLLAAALTAPHALGPWTGRLLDRWDDRRRVLASGAVVFGVAVGAGAVLLQTGHLLLAASGFAVAGAAGPLLTGGFSSLVSGLGAPVARARGVDAVTYGVAGTVGPAVVAAVASASSPLRALLGVAGAVVAAGVATGLVPATAPPERALRTGEPRQRFVLLRARPLRQVTITTVAAAAAGGALGVVAVVLAGELGVAAEAGWLVAALGLGNLVGAALTVWRPLQGEPVRQSLVLVTALAVATALVATVWSIPSGVVVFGAVGLITAPWVTATLHARERYAPPGRTGEVFVALAGVKVAGTSAGTALAGVVSGAGARPVALAAAALVLLAVAAVSPRASARRPARG
jgi:hypothetical protein